MRKYTAVILTLILFVLFAACTKRPQESSAAPREETASAETSADNGTEGSAAASSVESGSSESASTGEDISEIFEQEGSVQADDQKITEVNFLLPGRDAVRLSDGFMITEDQDYPQIYISSEALLKVMGTRPMTDEEFNEHLEKIEDCEACKSISPDQWVGGVIDENGSVTMISKDGTVINRLSVDTKYSKSEYGADMKTVSSIMTNIKMDDIIIVGEDGTTYYNVKRFANLFPSNNFNYDLEIIKNMTSFNVKITAEEIFEPEDVSSSPIYENGEHKSLGDLMSGSYLIYLKRETCPDCKEYEESILSQIKKSEVRYITIEVSKEPEKYEGIAMSSDEAKKFGLTQIPAVVMIRNNKFDSLIEHPGFTYDGDEIIQMITKK